MMSSLSVESDLVVSARAEKLSKFDLSIELTLETTTTARFSFYSALLSRQRRSNGHSIQLNLI